MTEAHLACACACAAWLACGCATQNGDSGFGDAGGTQDAGMTITGGGPPDSGGTVGTGSDSDSGGGGFAMHDSGATTDGGDTEDPATCAVAAASHSYVGCDFWPTIVFNPVWSVFDFAAVVANTGTTTAQVTTTRAGQTVAMTSVAPGSIGIVYLPWVTALKGPDFTDNGCTAGSRPVSSVFVSGGAYHLTSTVPVTVWQFNPLEYVAGNGGPSGKNWTCPYPPMSCNGNGVDCLSVSNDASLLLPSTAMTGTYRLFGQTSTTYGVNYPPPDQDNDSPGAFAVTATADNTHVTLNLVAGASLVDGSGITGTTGGSAYAAADAGGGTVSLTMNAGDVAELLDARGQAYGSADSDLSGSILTSDKPVQVIAFNAITDVPSPIVSGGGWADHLEETVLPAESLGAHYLVVPPTAPAGRVSYGHYVRFYGNRDGTTLTYPSGTAPTGAPTTLKAGQVVDLGLVTEAFEVKGSNEFEVASIMPGGQIQDPGSNDPQGDPSLTFSAAVEQYRSKYVFLAPTNYAEAYADVVVPSGAKVTLDGAPLSGVTSAIGSSGWSVVRAPLPSGTTTGTATGAHTLTSTAPVGLQIMGFGHATSYYTPGGYDVKLIAPPPPSVQ
jgi:hypothetical protein